MQTVGIEVGDIRTFLRLVMPLVTTDNVISDNIITDSVITGIDTC